MLTETPLFDKPSQSSDSEAAALQRVVDFFEQLQPADVARIADIYTADAQFKDPFNEVQGVPAIEAIFAHMFRELDAPRFVITQRVQQGAQCFVTWDFLFAMRRFDAGKTQVIRGASHLVLREEAGVWRVAVHRDYWDAAEELYEKLPVLGSLMRWLKRRANR
ncbi:isomerase [Limnohabitans sp. TS-CS-82]|uniref:nuclear transport factor 2 family protein n=1 Tax=Limnohabitans sp. TS-CS-82 TaxID=2094193 RepID=UPI000CF2974F|nr:nuclear transport factor 2 family protein [Limnohabitans sp. TS-CS-82]PQA83575.1 isomerase [Limnohabitans sp. TS-CS-82]